MSTENEIQTDFYRQEGHRFGTIIPNCFPPQWYECDLLAITKSGYMYEYEIKLTVTDFKNDTKKGHRDHWPAWYSKEIKTKHQRLGIHDPNGPSCFWFIVPEGLISPQEVPSFAGLIYFIESPWAHFVRQKKAPRLHSVKMSNKALSKARESLYYRYWNLRLDDLK